MIILLQSVTAQFRRIFWHTSYRKVRQSNFITKCDRLLLQSVSSIAERDRRHYKVHQLIQNVMYDKIIYDEILRKRKTLLWLTKQFRAFEK